MHLHPDIAALRSDHAPQCHAQNAIARALDTWREDAGVAELRAEFADYGAGAPLAENGPLERVFMEQGEGERLMLSLSKALCGCLAETPFGQAPFRNGFDGRTSSMLLAKSGRAQLLVQSREPGDYHGESRAFSDVVRYDAVLSGSGQARLVRLVDDREGRARFSEEPIALRPGARLALDLTSESLEVDRVAERLVILRLIRVAERPVPTREFARKTGALLQQCAGDLATSRQEATIALLGKMQRRDAVPHFSTVALGDGDPSLRWQALRECLALDTAMGFAALSQLARRSADPLVGDAGALRAQLLETYPQLAQLEQPSCPA